MASIVVQDRTANGKTVGSIELIDLPFAVGRQWPIRPKHEEAVASRPRLLVASAWLRLSPGPASSSGSTEEILRQDLVPDGLGADVAVPAQPGFVLADTAAGDLLVDRDQLLRPAEIADPAIRWRAWRGCSGT